MANRQFEGKVAVVTGSTSGIGQAIAERFASLGANVVVNGFGKQTDIDAQVLKLAADHGVQTMYHGADVTKSAEIDDLVAKTVAKFGKVDIVVNCAGIQRVHPVEAFPEDEFDAVISTNLKSVFLTTKAALPFMRLNKFGRIINIASAHAHVGSAGKIAYVAAKHALLGMNKVVAIECANDENVTINSVSPGWVKTPLVEKQLQDNAKALQEKAKKDGVAVPSDADAYKTATDAMLDKQPRREFTKPEAIAATCVFLASEEARTILGTDILVDGGWVAH